MKPSLRIVAAGIALIAASAGAGAPPENPAVRAPERAAAPWLLAQDRRMPTCKIDNRDVPTGTTSCRQKRLWVCERGDWVNTGKPC